MSKWVSISVDIHKTFAVQADSISEANDLLHDHLMHADYTTTDTSGPDDDEVVTRIMKQCADEIV